MFCLPMKSYIVWLFFFSSSMILLIIRISDPERFLKLSSQQMLGAPFASSSLCKSSTSISLSVNWWVKIIEIIFWRSLSILKPFRWRQINSFLLSISWHSMLLNTLSCIQWWTISNKVLLIMFKNLPNFSTKISIILVGFSLSFADISHNSNLILKSNLILWSKLSELRLSDLKSSNISSSTSDSLFWIEICLQGLIISSFAFSWFSKDSIALIISEWRFFIDSPVINLPLLLSFSKNAINGSTSTNQLSSSSIWELSKRLYLTKILLFEN